VAGQRPRLRLVVVQAAFGDCLILEARSAGGTSRILIDGGPGGTFEAHLAPVLRRIATAGEHIDVAVLSHIDNDHVVGLLDLFAAMRASAPASSPGSGLPPIRALWHNAFGQALGSLELEPRVRAALEAAGRSATPMPLSAAVLRGVGEGDELRKAAQALRIPINPGFAQGHVRLDGTPGVRLGDLGIDIVGPSGAILQRLRKQWERWLARRPGVAADRSVPNLSSIVMLARLGRRSILLTGDARGDHVLDGLAEAGLLGPDGGLHVSVLKMPHHGSIRNIDGDFLRRVTADTYVVSADGRYGNPDHEALAATVEAAHEARRPIELVFTNRTDSSDALVATHPPARFGYRTRFLARGRHSLVVEAHDPARPRARAWTG
jgi:hypothetical protein